MPKPNRPIILWRAKLLTLIGRPPRPGIVAILSASILLTVAGLFLGLTASSLHQAPPSGSAPGINGLQQSAAPSAMPDAVVNPPPGTSQTAAAPASPAKPAVETVESVRPVNQKPADVTKQMQRWKAPGPITLDYGWQEHPLYKDWRFHTGIDYQMEPGSPVLSLTDGEVKVVRRDDSLGLTVEVAAGEYTLIYASLNAANVREGTRVSAGAKLGSSGFSRSEPYGHLHLAIRKSGNFMNPQTLLQ